MNAVVQDLGQEVLGDDISSSSNPQAFIDQNVEPVGHEPTVVEEERTQELGERVFIPLPTADQVADQSSEARNAEHMESTFHPSSPRRKDQLSLQSR